ncbi:MAG: hypothetical protein NVV66_08550 [Cellulomonas sp.]|uniref:hypothetical protein n=1 Tax=Cellulomonas sp. TaxID=40001 RepID=UPI002589EC51|nr:hypothetical protein [Cellulomonas sp.]MCR6704732.1 hypothetical protein [Cellulomonas sp.]
MGDVVKSVLGGGWGLVVGWILPVFLAAQGFAYVIARLAFVDLSEEFEGLTWASQQLALLAVAAVLGLVLAAAQAPLYRVLEGYYLGWPWLVERRTNAHRARRTRLLATYETSTAAGQAVRAGLAYERAARYPADETQFAPTQLGNAIRRFETYARNRYLLDSQLLWHRLKGVAPQSAVDAITTARANVDFFVALLYGAVVLVVGAVVGLVVTGDPLLWLAAAGSVLVIVGAYRLAVLATDEWAATECAMVDLARVKLAEAYGVTIPDDLADERAMWRVICTFVRRPYTYSELKDVPALLTRYRTAPANDTSEPAASPTTWAELARALGRAISAVRLPRD